MTGAGPEQRLTRRLGVGGAVFTGLGSIIGTGVFVSIGIAAGVAGPSVVLAVVLAAIVATFNGLNSAQLAAAHPVSGGTYEYGYRYLTPTLGFTAGWMFLVAKSASAATAALGFAGYLLNLAGVEGASLVPLAVGAVVVLTMVVLAGLRRSNVVNIAIVSITLAALLVFVVGGVGLVESRRFVPFFGGPGNGIAGLLEATALMFVAYTGYGRIATLGEEVRQPAVTIPRAMIATLGVSMAIYISVTLVAVGTAGVPRLVAATESISAPLEVVARGFASPAVATVVAIGALTAMLGVLLNLILGLSRVLLAMGRRRDMPAATARIDRRGSTPYVAVVTVGIVIALLVLIGDVRTTWSFSAFTVLIYYAITNLAALRLPGEVRRYPRWIAWCGLGACVFLAFWVETSVWLVGLGTIATGLLWHLPGRRRFHG